MGEINPTSIFKFSPNILTKFLCWLFLPVKKILPFLLSLFIFEKVLKDSLISLNNTFNSIFDKDR